MGSDDDQVAAYLRWLTCPPFPRMDLRHAWRRPANSRHAPIHRSTGHEAFDRLSPALQNRPRQRRRSAWPARSSSEIESRSR